MPVVRLNTDRIRSLGWGNHMNTRAALKASLVSMLEEERAGLLTWSESSCAHADQLPPER